MKIYLCSSKVDYLVSSLPSTQRNVYCYVIYDFGFSKKTEWMHTLKVILFFFCCWMVYKMKVWMHVSACVPPVFSWITLNDSRLGWLACASFYESFFSLSLSCSSSLSIYIFQSVIWTNGRMDMLEEWERNVFPFISGFLWICRSLSPLISVCVRFCQSSRIIVLYSLCIKATARYLLFLSFFLCCGLGRKSQLKWVEEEEC